MQITHRHPPQPDPAARREKLAGLYTACVRALAQGAASAGPGGARAGGG